MFSGELKTKIDTEVVTKALLGSCEDFLRDKDILCIIHDNSPIRKPESKKKECLGKVTSLENGIVNGFDTFCSVLVDVKGAGVRLAACTPYSNGDPSFVGAQERSLYDSGRITDASRVAAIAESDVSGKSFDTWDVVSAQVRTISEHLEGVSPGSTRLSLYDRGFDSARLFELELELGNEFIIRLKGNRNGNEILVGSDGKEKAVKLNKQFFMEGDEVEYEHIRFRDKSYFGARASFNWERVEMNGHAYTALRVQLRKSGGERIFKEDMLLITSMEINNIDMARAIWNMYMLRMKIESVFRFCKQELNWEAPRVNDWETMKNLLSFVFFVAGFFYEIKDQLTKDPQCAWIAKLAGSKGKITVHFLLKGLGIIAGYLEIKRLIDAGELTEEDIRQAAKAYNLT